MSNQQEIICIICPLGCRGKVNLDKEGNIVDVANLQCKEGQKYVVDECKSPIRVLTATVLTESPLRKLLSVKTTKPIDRDRLMGCMRELAKIRVKPPVKVGQVIVSNILNLGTDIIATGELK